MTSPDAVVFGPSVGARATGARTVDARIVGARIVGARFVTPGDWTELDLNPSTRHTAIQRAVRRAVAHDPGLAGDAVRLIALLDDISRRATSAGAFYCASLVLDEAAGGVLVANLMLQLSGPSPVTAPHSFSMTQLCAGLAVAISSDPNWAGAEVEVVRLPLIGPAVRISVVAGGICLQYVVPLPAGDGELLVTFSCPCPGYVGVMTELFDTMASSLAMEYAPPGS